MNCSKLTLIVDNSWNSLYLANPAQQKQAQVLTAERKSDRIVSTQSPIVNLKTSFPTDLNKYEK